MQMKESEFTYQDKCKSMWVHVQNEMESNGGIEQ